MRALAVILMASCGGSHGGMAGGGDDTGPGSDASTHDGAGGDAAAPTHAGSITIQSYTAEQPAGNIVMGGTASAGFPTTSRCAVQTDGACEIDTCSGAVGPLASAGTITATGTAAVVSLAPAADGYTQLTFGQPLFGGGETLGVSAAGGVVPAFDGTVVAPSKIQITSPVKPATFLPITRADGFTVTWTGGGTGVVEVALFAGSDLFIACKFPVSAKTGTVPASVLALVPPGNSGGFAMAAIDEAHLVAGDWAITLLGYYNAVWTDDSIVSGPTTVN